MGECEYQELKARADRNREWSAQFIKPNGWAVITAEEQETCPENARISNEERSKIEVYEWLQDKPDSHFLYIDGNKATTWTGDALGTVEYLREYRDNFGGVRQSIIVRGNNGRLYHGTCYKSSGSYARIKAYKGH